MFHRMDPKSSYLLEIRLVSNPRCRKEISCFREEKERRKGTREGKSKEDKEEAIFGASST
jgi:hypothetical protein